MVLVLLVPSAGHVVGEDASPSAVEVVAGEQRHHRKALDSQSQVAADHAGEAVRLPHRVDPIDLPPGLVSRRAQLHLDLAWAYTQHRRDAETIVQMLEAEQIAPQLIQFHPVVRSTVADLVGRSRGGAGLLHDLAVRAGVLT